MVAVKTGFTPPPVPGMPAPMQPMGGMPPMGGAPMRNPFAPMPPMPLAGMPPPPAQPPMAQQPMPQMQQQGSNALRRRRFGDSLEGMLSRNQGLGGMVPQRRPLPMPPQMMPQPRMVAPGIPMMRTPTPRPMAMGGEVDIFGYDDGGPVQYMNEGGLAILTLPDGNAYIDFGGGAYHHVSPNEPGQDVVASLQSAYGDRIGEVRVADQGEQDYIFSKVDYGKGQNLTEDTTTNTTNTTNTDNTAVTTGDVYTNTNTAADTSQNTAVMTGDIGSSGTGADTSSLFGPNINIPEKASQFVQNPVTGQITTTAGPTMTAVSPIGAINLPAAPVSIDIFDYLGDPTYGSLLDEQVEGMAQGGSVQGFDMGGHAHPHNNNSSIGPSGYMSLDAIANQAVQADDDKSFKHMGKTYDNVRDYHDAIFGDDDDDDDDVQDFNNPNAGDGGGSTTSLGAGSAGSLGGGSTGGGSSSAPPPAPPTPVVYRDMYGRTYGSQAEADAANRMIIMQQSSYGSSSDGVDASQQQALNSGVFHPNTPREVINQIGNQAYLKSGADLAREGILPASFTYSNIGGIGDGDSGSTGSGFNLPPAVVEPDVGGGTAQTLGLGLDTQYPDVANIINLDAPSPDDNTTSGVQPASNTTTLPPPSGVSSDDPYDELNQGLGNVKPKPRPNLGNQSTGSKTTGGGDPGYRPPPNAAETAYLQNLLGQFEFDDQGKMVFAEPGTVEKVINQIVKNLSLGLIDMEDLDNQKVQAVLDAYKQSGRFAYDSESGASLDLSETLLGPDGKLDPDKLKAFDEKIKIFQGDGIEPAVTGVYDSEGNIVSYGPDIKNTKDGPVVVDDVDIFGSDSNGSSSNTTTDGPDTGHTVTEDGTIVCNEEGYIYNPETKICEPPKVTEESDDVNVNIGSGVSGTSFDDVLANVVIPAPDIAPISANIRPMKMGGMAGLNRAADNFIKALAG